MFDRRLHLKVKIKSLAAEARIIREEERKHPHARESLALHRKGIVRSVARDSLIAYGFIRGRAYRDMEPTASTSPNWKKVEDMATRFGPSYNPSRETYAEFKERKKEYFKRLASWLHEATNSTAAIAA